MPEQGASVGGVASHLGGAKDSVYRWIETKGLPARVGRLSKFKLLEIDKWVHGGSDGCGDSAGALGAQREK